MNNSINVYSDLTKFAKGNIWYPNAKNFPAVKALWISGDMARDEDDNGEEFWTDRISGLKLKGLPVFTHDDLGISGGMGTPDVDADLPAIGDNHLLLMHVGTLNTANNSVTFGDEIDIGIRLRGNANDVTRTGTDWATIPALTGATYPLTGSLGIFVDRVADVAEKYAASDDGTYAENQTSPAPTGTYVGPWDTFGVTANIIPVNGGSKVIALWGFETQPDDVAVALKWMAANPGLLYPGWAGRL